ncbi:Uncharacterized protein OBRU01_13532 [Operophtera brumata]|uniref:ODAD1 central coiled coil region domain-containing protein n=1 Tax=Operophtera brumata TaxID=104452 RepID=A0A0L7L8V1_OPEBR|nr:Uncharacterized protein OBRU01_13532 [Operophtera brumata]
MPQEVEQKTVDPEKELSNVQRLFKKLAPACSVEKRAGGIPQLAPQEKQLGILKYELKETLLCINKGTKHCIVEYEQLESVLREERAQQQELDCLNYLAQKQLELAMIENASNRLRRMENRLDLATKRFCLIAAVAFGARDECCRKLEVVQWKGLFQLNRDISEMQSYEGELNHLAKLEEFLRVKGSRRICEADEKEEMKRQEEIQRCEQEIARHDALLDEIFAYFGSDRIASIISRFQKMEIENFSCFVLLCEVLQESIVLRRDVELLRQRILDQRDINTAREDEQDRQMANYTQKLEAQRARTQEKQQLDAAADATINRPPAPTPKGRKPAPAAPKLVADPYVEPLRPNIIQKLVPYQPCAYCVEDYIMNLVFETPAIPADKEYIEGLFHLEDVNTKFGIYTLTIPAKRHPYRGPKKD